KVASSRSARASSKSSAASARPPPTRESVPTTASSTFFSLPSSWARRWSPHTSGSERLASTSASRFSLPSTSKIPPQLRGPALQVGERGGDLVDAFGFHGRSSLSRFHALAPIAHFLAEARLGLEPVERHDEVAAGDGDEGLLQALAHGGE